MSLGRYLLYKVTSAVENQFRQLLIMSERMIILNNPGLFVGNVRRFVGFGFTAFFVTRELINLLYAV